MSRCDKWGSPTEAERDNELIFGEKEKKNGSGFQLFYNANLVYEKLQKFPKYCSISIKYVNSFHIIFKKKTSV